MATTTYKPSPDGTHFIHLKDAVALGYGSYQTLRRYIADGRLPTAKIGGRVKLLRADLDALVVPTAPSNREPIESAVERVVAAAPPLTPKQRERLAVILGGAS
ncbi:helix-turn-helix domain-containing protein [Brevibacterium aurantiacum]|uniref:DNA-binding protein n=1 Tax=Brevibacterium aurantiacum TaxID=273384 RepID=A0A2A3Z2U3_BREAU|nr:helix-turn-helix domain-containing protein [Brevibacterium aurantiacum]PCC45838.1 DNA-binding protein [Brevibacterium aurantiacum]